MVFEKSSEKPIGFICLDNINKLDNRCSLTYYIYPNYRNKGYVIKATKILIDYGFKKLKIHKINLNHVKWNDSSKKVIKKLGGKYEGIDRKGVLTGDGLYKDHIIYSILKEEWGEISL